RKALLRKALLRKALLRKALCGCASACRLATLGAPRAATNGFPMRLCFQRALTGFVPNRLVRPATRNASSGTIRQRVSRLVRRALSFSKSLDMHELWLRIFFTEHNPHLSLATHA